MLERLNVFLGGCGGKGAQDGDCIETLNQDRNALEKEGALAVIIGVLVMRLPKSPKKFIPASLIAPMVSTATGTNK